uniref:methyl-CpG-binding domain-containing protein 9-like n=1 Tax=Erigeron canadensis TaxID=72917 RepID=UPI001CB92B95|nr:methyl-CpG-binding domain-containing protein 9-like [Erigeron canadensis]
MECTKITESPLNKKSFPQGSLISSRLPSHAVGNLLEVHEFICGFQNVLGLKEPISFEELEEELLRAGKSSILKTVEKFIHSVLLPDLISELLEKTTAALKIKLDMLPINQFTWPEVVRRYIMAYVLVEGRMVSENIEGMKLFQCLLGDGGICCESQASLAGVDLDAQLLGRAIENVFGKLTKETTILSMGMTGIEGQNGDSYGVCTDVASIPEWAKVLEPVKKLPTNNGSRIRDCVNEALTKNPLEWAKTRLEASISKGVYKSNASGPTKKAVIAVFQQALNNVASGVPKMPLPLDTDIRRSDRICKAVMKKCQSIICHVAANSTDRDFSDLLGRSLNCDISDVQKLLIYASTRPLDLQTIHLRLLHGAYGGSHEAFREDVRELGSSLKLWIKLTKTPVNKPSLSHLAECISKDLEIQFEKEVAPLILTLSEYNTSTKSTVEVERELQEILTSIEISETPWEMIICKVCGHGTDDENMLLCDSEGCNAAYHTKCLCPTLSRIPEGRWHCPTCAPSRLPMDNEPKDAQQILRHVDRSWEEASPLLDIVTALDKSDFWELEADKKISVLKFLFDEALNTKFFRQILNKSNTKLNKKFLGIDSLGRFYWGFPSSSPNCGIVVNSQHEDYARWYILRSAKEISSLVNYLNINDPEVIPLRDAISHWHSLVIHQHQQPISNSGETHMTNSTDLDKSSKKPGGNASPIIKKLKMKLLSMEDALTDGARRPSRASREWRSAWCAFVKSSNSIYEMIEAILVLETMIKTEHISNNWWWYWSSASVAAKTSTMSGLALRIYTLDAAIHHPNTPPDRAKKSAGNGNICQKRLKRKRKAKISITEPSLP